jgi:hypothetical protein
MSKVTPRVKTATSATPKTPPQTVSRVTLLVQKAVRRHVDAAATSYEQVMSEDKS